MARFTYILAVLESVIAVVVAAIVIVKFVRWMQTRDRRS